MIKTTVNQGGVGAIEYLVTPSRDAAIFNSETHRSLRFRFRFLIQYRPNIGVRVVY